MQHAFSGGKITIQLLAPDHDKTYKMTAQLNQV